MASVVIIFIWFTSVGGTAYTYALHLEEKWSKANPQSKLELERHLSLYSEKQINPFESLWGRDYQLKENERMIQYNILWDAPLDVVYDNNDKIIRIYTSYE